MDARLNEGVGIIGAAARKWWGFGGEELGRGGTPLGRGNCPRRAQTHHASHQQAGTFNEKSR